MTLPDESATIAAIATAAGSAGVGILRLSGSKALKIAETLTQQHFSPRQATFSIIRDRNGDILDHGIVIFFSAPASFTGEDVIEFHCHGSPVLLNVLLRECVDQGARMAEPGEFSQRAFLNDKMDLVQAEAIADLIGSGSEAAMRGATRSLTGAFSRQVNELLTELVRLRVFVEAAIDFPEEEIDFIADGEVRDQLQALRSRIENLLGRARRGRALRDGLTVVIAGAPNAGKSSLLNQLAEHDSAIVTDVPGTTRDVLREYIQIAGLPLHIVDTAGLRSASDSVEQEGIRRARNEMRSADHILLMVDSSRDIDLREELAQADLADLDRVTVLRNKCDLAGVSAGVTRNGHLTEISLSAKTGEGMQHLREHLLALAGLGTIDGSDFSARERHIRALEETSRYLRAGDHQLSSTGAAELLAEELRYAQDALGRITGHFSSDDLLGEIFSSFCIGK